MKLESVTISEVQQIITELEKGKRRPQSGDFLDGFPLRSMSWHKGALGISDLEHACLFWDGIAWGQSGSIHPRTLREGALAFMQIDNDPGQSNNEHLKQVKDWLDKCRSGKLKTDQPYLILAGLNRNGPFIIMDGNHRAAAALWWAIESSDQRQLPLVAWVGFSPQMNQHRQYLRILQSR